MTSPLGKGPGLSNTRQAPWESQAKVSDNAPGLLPCPRATSVSPGPVGTQPSFVAFMEDIKTPEAGQHTVQLTDGAVFLSPEQITGLGGLFTDLQLLEEGDVIPLPGVSKAVLEKFLAFKEDQDGRLSDADASDLLNFADRVGNSEVVTAVIRQLLMRAIVHGETTELKCTIECLPQGALENRLGGQLSLNEQVDYISHSFSWSPMERLCHCLGSNMLEAAECLGDVYSQEVFDGFHQDMFVELLRAAFKANNVESVSTLKRLMRKKNTEHGCAMHMNFYCRFTGVSNHEFRLIKNSAFAGCVSSLSETAVRQSWLSVFGQDYNDSLTGLEESMEYVQTPAQATTSFLQLLNEYQKASDVLSDDGGDTLKTRTITAFQALIDRGADINGQRGRLQNRSALEVAVLDHDFATAELLLQLGVDIDHQFPQRDNTTVYMQVCRTRDKVAMEFLYQHNADKDIEDNNGHTVFNHFNRGRNANPLTRQFTCWNARLASSTAVHHRVARGVGRFFGRIAGSGR